MHLPRFTKPSYLPLAWLSIIWAVASLAYILLSIGGSFQRMVWSALGAIVCTIGIWLRLWIAGVLLMLGFAYSVVTKVAHVIHGDFPRSQIANALLHVLFVGVIAIWLYREWIKNGATKEKPNQALLPTPTAVTPAAAHPPRQP